MRLNIKQNSNIEDMIVSIEYIEKDPAFFRVLNAVKGCGKKIRAKRDSETIWVVLADIFYFESVDKKTFLYLKKEVLMVDLRLYQLKEELCDYGFVQINKGCILNINVLESVTSLANSKMQALLANGEKLPVTRNYIQEIKEALKSR